MVETVLTCKNHCLPRQGIKAYQLSKVYITEVANFAMRKTTISYFIFLLYGTLRTVIDNNNDNT